MKQGRKFLPQSNNIWVQIVRAKFLTNNSNFRKINKTKIAYMAWQNILDNR